MAHPHLATFVSDDEAVRQRPDREDLNIHGLALRNTSNMFRDVFDGIEYAGGGLGAVKIGPL
jgi:hypothetical protein